MRKKKILKVVGIIAVVLLLIIGAAIYYFYPGFVSLVFPGYTLKNSPVYKIPPEERTEYDWIVIGAREEVYNKVDYDAAYQSIDYPMGDVDPKVGACTDVIIRALRQAGHDLQQLIHEDMKANFELYPNRWGLTKPDPNIDHRRVPNQMVFLERYGTTLPTKYNQETKDTWQPGDIVYWKMPTGRDHTGIISDGKDRKGVPLVIHNAFRTIEDNALLRWEIKGHYRYPPQNNNGN